MTTYVFDSSAILAVLYEEKGHEVATKALRNGGYISAANWSELAQKTNHTKAGWDFTRSGLKGLGIIVEPVTEHDAEIAAGLWEKGSGLSLADRLCLALAQRLKAEVLTADSEWKTFPHVTCIR